MHYNRSAPPIENEQWGERLSEFARFKVALYRPPQELPCATPFRRDPLRLFGQPLELMSGPGVYFWRAIYGVLEFSWLRRLLACRYRSLERTRGSGVARKFLRRTLFALSANRLRNYQGYVPLQAWQAFWEIARRVDSTGQVPRRAAQPREKLRVGLAGMIAYLPFYPRKLFCDLPPEMEIHLFETVRELPPDHYLRHTDAASLHNVILKWNNDLPRMDWLRSRNMRPA